MTTTRTSPRDLQSALEGDLRAFARLVEVPHQTLLTYQSHLPGSNLSAKAVQRVLQQLARDTVEPTLVQQWASFVKRGFVAGKQSACITPLDVQYDQAHEGVIIEALARMDEIGDLVDGEMTSEEIAQLIEQLSA